MSCIYVDWSGGWATPWGSAIEERRLKPSHPLRDQHWRLARTDGNQPHVIVISLTMQNPKFLYSGNVHSKF